MPQPKTSTMVKPQIVSYREVLRHLGSADELEPQHDVRACVLDRFKLNGGDYTRWTYLDYISMSDAITRMEDILELRKETKNRDEARLTLQSVRRRLEILVGDR